MTDLLRHVTSVLSSPWAITREGFDLVCDIVDRRAGGIRFTPDEIRAVVEESRAEFSERHAAAGSPMVNSTSKSVAVIAVYGTILPRQVLSLSGGGGTTMTGFMDRFKQADADPSVGAILLDIDSPGGSAALVPEAAAMIRNASKPVTAIANTMSGSAAYYLMSQADDLVASPSAMVGSIGVFLRHIDASAAYAQDGLDPTLIYAGEFKVEGNDTEPLGDAARAYLQATVDDFYDQFVADVAQGRGVSEDDVRSGFGQGRMLTARNAVAAGLVDRVATFDEVVSQMLGTTTSGSFQATAALEIDAAPLLIEDLKDSAEVPAETADDAAKVVNTQADDTYWRTIRRHLP